MLVDTGSRHIPAAEAAPRVTATLAATGGCLAGVAHEGLPIVTKAG